MRTNAAVEEEFSNLAVIHMKADQLARKLAPKLPNGRQMMHLYKPMSFTKKKHGLARIEKETSQCFEVVNMRYTFLLGIPRMSVNYGEPVTFHRLYYNNSMLTSDKPVEVFQQYLSFSKVHGRVLVGGLGLGMAAEMILRLPKVASVTVIEKEKAIIDLIQPQIDPRIKVIHADLYEYLKSGIKGQYDSAYHDIWYSCSEADWAKHLVPLYRLTRAAGIKMAAAWGEYEMQAQLRSALFARAQMPLKYSYWKPYAVFLNALVKEFALEPPFSEAAMDRVASFVKLYLTKVGTKAWEKTFDWDAVK